MPRGEEWVTFRQPFWRWYLAALVFGQVIFPVLNAVPAILSPHFGWTYFWKTYPFGAAAITIVFAPAMFAYVRLWRTRVSPAGLSGSNAWGWPLTVPWRSIDQVKPFPLPGLPSLRVYSKETRLVLWLPLFLNDFPRFVELVEQYAGSNHPLTVAVRQHLPPDV